MSIRTARAALKRAQSQLERVQTAWIDPPDPVEAVTFAFYAYENAVVAVAEAKNIRWTKRHDEKADLAGRLFRDGILPVDVEDCLRQLNAARKDVAYGEPGPELEQMDLEGLATDLEQFIDEVEGIVEAAENE